MREKNCKAVRILSLFDTSTQTYFLKPGKCTVDGRQMSVNNDFATQVIYLAQVLACSERYISRLMQYVISHNPNFSPVNILEQVVLEHHRRRRDLADCIQFLLEAAEMAGSPGTTALHARLELFVKQQLIPSKEGADRVIFGEKGSGWKVLSELEALDRTISLALAAKQNAGSNTTIQGLLSPSFAPAIHCSQHSDLFAHSGTVVNLGSDILSMRVESLIRERHALATYSSLPLVWVTCPLTRSKNWFPGCKRTHDTPSHITFFVPYSLHLTSSTPKPQGES